MTTNSLGSSLHSFREKLKKGVDEVRGLAKIAIIPLFLMAAPIAKGQGVGINPTGANPDPNAMLDVAGGPTYVDDLRIRNIFSGVNGAILTTDINGDVNRTNLPSVATQYLDGTGNFTTPGGSSKWTLNGTRLHPNNIADNVNIGKLTLTDNNKLSVVGGVAIGTNVFTNAAADANGLNVLGNSKFGTSTATTAKLTVHLSSFDPVTHLFEVRTELNTYLFVDNNGFTSLGRQNPQELLHIENNNPAIRLGSDLGLGTAYTNLAYNHANHLFSIRMRGDTPFSIPLDLLRIDGDTKRITLGENATAETATVTIKTIYEDHAGLIVQSDATTAPSLGGRRAAIAAEASTLGTETIGLITNGDVYITDFEKGVILTAPNGECWRITVQTGGALLTTLITCP